MLFDKLKKIKDAPDCGQYLIYTRKEVMFEKYASLDVIMKILENNDVLEMHLFDDDLEYRAIVSDSKRFPNGVIEHICKVDSSDLENTFADRTALEKDKRELWVINELSYDSNGMISIADYRLKMGGMN